MIHNNDGLNYLFAKHDSQSAEFSPPPVLDGFFLLKHCCVDDPVDLCVVNVVDKGLVEANKEDLSLFVNVAVVNAGEIFTFKAFTPSSKHVDTSGLVAELFHQQWSKRYIRSGK